MATITVHRVNPGDDITEIVKQLNAVVDLVNELKTLVDGHITGGAHRTAASTNAGATLSTKAAADKIALGH